MNCLRVSPSQLRYGSWAYIKVFQLYAKHKSYKPSLELFFNLFYASQASRDDVQDQGLISLCLNVPWFDIFAHDWG